MGYVAVKGGTAAIEESIKRLKYERLKKGHVLDFHKVLQPAAAFPEGGRRLVQPHQRTEQIRVSS